ncbi:hypothetical protein CLU79DRAFT_806242 [Phycomyces nitens]|nr:hypothetical protein CLU79DRAFT_806242 [Phycomyces nitens]
MANLPCVITRAAVDKDFGEFDLTGADSNGSDDYPKDESLLYIIKDDKKKFQSTVSSSKDTPECLKIFKTFQEQSFVLAKSLYNIILLKKVQSYPNIDMSVLYKNMLDGYRNYEKVDKSVFSNITEVFRTDDIGSSRDELKIMLFKVYENADKTDRNPTFHRPEGDKLFLWLNKSALKSYNKRPDAGCAVILERRVVNYSSFIEVKVEYKKKDAISLHEDLLRLSLFGTNALEENQAKCILLIQIIDWFLTSG